ncbi:hypothetical protein [cf. Phormidesmis sp. LEGE 11477]|uniref:hypothetical protein n=1 Tax=cf. Phormidesmis sp. LEGE 11477 TaxID=1828680 RepID=UPI00187F5FA6|nr:hypothetical protein [cf. Phormidesmis sp. LEGE 11477]MBE9064833.1 hypothetical protein [cf. Phormidesmis sp. LEGE 11477]
MKVLQRACQERLKMSLECIGLMMRCVSSGGTVLANAQQENQQLVQRLSALRADYNQLKRDSEELLRYADRELTWLKQTNTGLAKEFDDLQLRVWELEQQVDELLLYIAAMSGAADAHLKTAADTGESEPNLSNLVLGIVGGHEATRREVIHELTEKYGLRRCAEVPPTWEGRHQKRVVRQKLEHCDLIVIITGYMNHSLTQAVFALKESGALRGEVELLNFRGKSGVVREILRLASRAE